MVTNIYIKGYQNHNLKILDLMDNNGNSFLWNIVNYSITVMNYNSMITVIPHKWKKKTIKHEFANIDLEKLKLDTEPYQFNS